MPPAADTTARDAKFREAQALYRQGKLADAGRLCQDVAAGDPTHFEAWHLAGVIAFQTGQMSEAITLLGKAIGLRPGSAQAYNSLGNVLAQLGRPEQALLSYAQATTLEPDFAEANYNHSNMIRELRRPTAVVVNHEAAANCCSPGAPPSVWARSRRRHYCRQCATAAFQCVDPCDEPSMGIPHGALDRSVPEC
jgi:tetratricopeptide (TPR) repeat protein